MNYVPILQDYSQYDVNSVVFKITDRCNLGCVYCYRENADFNGRIQDIDVKTIDKTLESIFEFKNKSKLNNNLRPSLYFIWHGGEPLFVGHERFYEILEIQNKYIDQGYIINNSVQTNGTLIDDEFAKIFKDNNFRVGVSIDGPENIQNIFRLYRNGKSSFKETYEGIQCLKRNNISWSAISVLNREYVGYEQEIFDFFNKEAPWEVDFTPSFFYDSSLTMSPGEYAKFMKAMFDIWICEDDAFDIRFFKDVMYILGYRRIENKASIICELSGTCHRNISIGTNGDLYSCECLNSKKTNLIGNVLNDSFSDIIKGDKFKTMAENTNRFCRECMKCDVFSVCKAGCYNRRLPDASGVPKLDYYCKARKEIIKYIQKRCNNILSKYSNSV